MARARNIKPGYFFNHELAQVDPLGRILFIGLWCIADRKGRLKDRPARIKAETLPYDDCDIDDLLRQLEEYGFILRYEIDGNKYVQVINFTKHQNPHKNERDSEIPAPECSHTSTIQAPEHSDTNPADSLLLIPDSLVLKEEPKTPPAEHGDTTTEERENLNTMKSIKDYPFDYQKDLDLLRQLSVDFPDIDIRAQIKRFATYKLDKPLSKKSNPRLQLRNWMEKAREFKNERSAKSGASERHPAGRDPAGKYRKYVKS